MAMVVEPGERVCGDDVGGGAEGVVDGDERGRGGGRDGWEGGGGKGGRFEGEGGEKGFEGGRLGFRHLAFTMFNDLVEHGTKLLVVVASRLLGSRETLARGR